MQLSLIKRTCHCQQFDGVDPVDKIPTNREIFNHYVSHGPIQPPQSEIRKTADKTGRIFQASWYARFDWLEYSLKQQGALCFVCRVFSSDVTYAQRSGAGGHISPDATFTETGFKNWKAALDKGKGFQRHNESSAHRHALLAYKNFVSQKSVDLQIDEHNEVILSARQQAIAKNRNIISNIFGVVRLLARLCLPFWGHDDKSSTNRGLFLELIHYLADNGNQALKEHILTAPRNATYFGHRTQNEMIGIIGEAVKDEVRRQILAAKYYVVMMDETRDLSGTEQVIVVIRYVLKGTSKVQERLIALVDAHQTTGEALENLLLAVLENNNLSIAYIVAQCYDGGSNLAGPYKGVQARIRQRNNIAIFIQCFAHSLNRAVVNAMNHKSLPEPRNFFSILEALVVFIKGGHRLHFFLNEQSLLIKEAQAVKQKKQGTQSVQESDDEDDSCVDVEPAQPKETSPSVDSTSTGTQTNADNGNSGSGTDIAQDRPLAPGKGICDTRWDARASTLHLYTKPIVLRAALKTVEHVIETSDDRVARASANGLKKSILEPKFLMLLAAFRPVLGAVNTVSKILQTVQIDIGAALKQVESLKAEIQLLRSDEAWEKARLLATRLGNDLGVDIEEELQRETRRRKIPRRIDDNPETEVHLTPLNALRTQSYLKAIDKLLAELDSRFPKELEDWKYLQPKHFFDPMAETSVSRLAQKYRSHLQPDHAMTQWRIFRHTPSLESATLAEMCSAVPESYESLKTLYTIFLTLPITTSTLERGLSKLPIVKNRLRTTMAQDRLESLMLATVESDITLSLKIDDLVSRFAGSAERRISLG